MIIKDLAYVPMTNCIHKTSLGKGKNVRLCSASYQLSPTHVINHLSAEKVLCPLFNSFFDILLTISVLQKFSKGTWTTEHKNWHNIFKSQLSGDLLIISHQLSYYTEI